MAGDTPEVKLLEERIRTLMQLARVGTWELDLQTGERTYSPELLELLGLPRAHGDSAAFYEALHPDDRPVVRKAVERAVQDGTPYRLTVRMRNASGEWLQFETQAAVERDESGRPVRIRGLATEVSARTRVEEERRRAEALREQLQQSDRLASVGLLAAGVAHEVSGPLSAVLGNVELALEGVADLAVAGVPAAVRMKAELEDARDAAGRVLQIARDLKVFSRAEVESPADVDVRAGHETAQRRANKELASDARLGQVFLNLIVNAAQAIPEGDAPHNEIRVATRVDPSGLVAVAVSDTGSGMPLEVLERLFTPFFTTKPSGVGTGLGLAICQRIVVALGGEIRVDSQVGRGTTFEVLLPPAPAGRVAVAIASSPPAEAPATRRGRILVVDDDEMVGTMVGRALDEDHDVEIIGHPHEAAARIQQGARFDVILSDLMMPEMTGMELHASISAVCPEQAARMVFLTGGIFTERAQTFLSAVPNARLEKPFRVGALRALVAERVR